MAAHSQLDKGTNGLVPGTKQTNLKQSGLTDRAGPEQKTMSAELKSSTKIVVLKIMKYRPSEESQHLKVGENG